MSPGRPVQLGVALFLAAFLCGCSIVRDAASGDARVPDVGVTTSDRGDGCKQDRAKCKYEGAYEPRERDYAEQEAKRLNRAASDRFRRSTGG